MDGLELGLYLYQQKDQSVNINISGDPEDVKQVKSLLSVMIARDASARPSIQEVVDNLTYLLKHWSAKELHVPDIIRSKYKIIYHFIRHW